MNVRIFFVKNAREYFYNSKEILKALGLENFETIKNFQIPDAIYQKAVESQFVLYNPEFKELYENELYGETEIDGLKIDFNFGLRLDVPEGNWHVRISDFDSETIFFDEDISNTRLISSEGYYIHWHIEVFHDGVLTFEHVFDPSGQEVLIYSRTIAIGDTLSFLPYVDEFRRVHNCKVKIFLPAGYLSEIVKHLYPEIEQVQEVSQNYYATYYIAYIIHQLVSFPTDLRTISLEKFCGMLLGLKTVPRLPNFTPTKKRKIKSPYVCIAVQASHAFKGWHWPGGWDIVVDHLKKLGYRVLCIDAKKTQTDRLIGGKGSLTSTKPEKAEDFTGKIPLMDRANMLYYADFFIGIGSGLSWLANSVGCPVVLISGFSQDWAEFYTPYRVSNRFVCNGCFNDVHAPRISLKTCYLYSGTPRELECQKKISPRQVIQAIDQLIKDKNLSVRRKVKS